MEKFTVDEFQFHFDELMERVENGESFIINSEYGDAVIVPYNQVSEVFVDTDLDEDIVKIYTDHEEGS